MVEHAQLLTLIKGFRVAQSRYWLIWRVHRRKGSDKFCPTDILFSQWVQVNVVRILVLFLCISISLSVSLKEALLYSIYGLYTSLLISLQYPPPRTSHLFLSFALPLFLCLSFSLHRSLSLPLFLSLCLDQLYFSFSNRYRCFSNNFYDRMLEQCLHNIRVSIFWYHYISPRSAVSRN